MGTAATKAKNKYNARNYVRLYLSVRPEVAERFRAVCGKDSQAVTLSRLLDAVDAGALEAAKKEYVRLCGEWDKLESKAKEVFEENARLRDELAKEKEKGLWQVVRERLLG